MPAVPLPELRLAFAMGGGVSLGVFSGAALGETLKMAVLSTVKFNNVPPQYSKVEVDVFSGASAGSLSLALMLRTLLAPPRLPIPNGEPWDSLRALANQLQVPGDPWDRIAHASLTKDLGRAFIDSLSMLHPVPYAQLIASERVQLVQACAWRDRVTIAMLLGATQPNGRIGEGVAGLVDRAAVDALGDEALGYNTYDFTKRQLLADRLIYACTIGRLSPHMSDARGEFGDDALTRLTLSDGMRSADHADVRVFDIRLGSEAAKTQAQSLTDPSRWVRARDGAEIPGYVDSLASKSFWQKIRATAVASGCVPFAFEPVVLDRRWYELPPDVSGDVTYPNPKAPQPPHLKRYDVCYDGGSFNNEPIREAFRLSSFKDSLYPDVPFVRRVVFVDPNANEIPASKRIAVLERFRRDRDAGSRTASSGDRLLAFAGPLVASFWGQARMVEGTKIAATRKRFAERDKMRANLARFSSPLAAPEAKDLADMALELSLSLFNQRRAALMPPGGLELSYELRRVIVEEQAALFPNLKLIPRDQYPIDRNGWLAAQHLHEWGLALQFVQLDEAMDLIGKHSQAKLVGISPIDPDSVPVGPPQPGELKPFELLGSPFFAFGGFCSPAARALDASMGKACARYLISLDVGADGMGHAAASLRPHSKGPQAGGPPDLWPVVDRATRERIKREVAAQVPAIKQRVKDVAASMSIVSDSGWLSRNVMEIIIDKAVDKIISDGPPEPFDFEFMIYVPSAACQMVQPGLLLNDDSPRHENGRWFFRTFAKCQPKGNIRRWEGPHISSGTDQFVIDLPGMWSDVRVPLPPAIADERAYEAWEAEQVRSQTCARFECNLRGDGSFTPWVLMGTNFADDGD